MGEKGSLTPPHQMKSLAVTVIVTSLPLPRLANALLLDISASAEPPTQGMLDVWRGHLDKGTYEERTRACRGCWCKCSGGILTEARTKNEHATPTLSLIHI